MDRSSSLGPGTDSPSSVLAQRWKEGSSSGSLMNNGLLREEGELSGSVCSFLQLSKGVYTHPTTSMGNMWVCHSAKPQ